MPPEQVLIFSNEWIALRTHYLWWFLKDIEQKERKSYRSSCRASCSNLVAKLRVPYGMACLQGTCEPRGYNLCLSALSVTYMCACQCCLILIFPTVELKKNFDFFGPPIDFRAPKSEVTLAYSCFSVPFLVNACRVSKAPRASHYTGVSAVSNFTIQRRFPRSGKSGFFCFKNKQVMSTR